ncbi:hypothetical protein ACFPM7_18860, partial [Actinokineospora guangxiensis]
MRWKFWAPPAPAHSGGPAAPGAATPGDAATPSPDGRAASPRSWTHLPALNPTLTAPAPLITGAAPIRPPLTSTRLESTSRPDCAGKVEGLASVLPLPDPPPLSSTPPTSQPPTSPLPASLPPPPTARKLPTTAPTDPPQLTRATDEYVGEAREPAQPHRAPGWLRHIPDWLKPESGTPCSSISTANRRAVPAPRSPTHAI